jgi:DNA repair exonuclease SbcCD ATPase subunit
MARPKNGRNGRLEAALEKLTEGQAELEKAQAELGKSQTELDKALRHMLQTHAVFQQNQAAFQAQWLEVNREIAELRRQSDARFARIEAILLDHSRILAEHTRILQGLPEAVREKIGFRMPGTGIATTYSSSRRSCENRQELPHQFDAVTSNGSKRTMCRKATVSVLS